MASAIHISIATPDDAPGIYAVQRQTWLDTYPNARHGITIADIETKFPIDSSEGIDRKRDRLRIQSDDAREWVAKDSRQIVGWAVGLKKNGFGELAALYVHPGHQGKKVGAQLMKLALDWLGNEHEVIVYAAAYNRKALNFYESWGFHPKGLDPENDSILPSGTKIPALKMCRPPQK